MNNTAKLQNPNTQIKEIKKLTSKIQKEKGSAKKKAIAELNTIEDALNK